MRRLVLVAALVAVALPSAAVGNAPTNVNGGGRGTVDGLNPFSQFGFQVSQSSTGSVHGHFNCLMAGSSQFLNFTLMAVRGQVTSLSVSGSTATFAGSGTLIAQTGSPEKKFPVTFQVVVTAGGPGVGTLKLTAFAPSPFGTVALPVEHVLTGHIAVG